MAEIDNVGLIMNDLKADISTKGVVDVFVCIQGGGAKGSWQGGVLEALTSSKYIRVCGAAGSSAGAINSVLISAKKADLKSKVFKKFWFRIPFVVNSLVISLLIGAVLLFFLVRLFVIITIITILVALFVNIILKDKNRFAAILLPFSWYHKIFELILPVEKAEIYTHIHITNTDEMINELRGLNDFPPVCFQPHDTHSDSFDGLRISIPEAVAISSALPMFVAGKKIGADLYADGGLHSNLPLESFFNAGNIGADLVLCLCPIAIKSLDENNYVENRMLRMLYDFKEKQIEGLEAFKQGESIFSAQALSRLFLIEPSDSLKSGLGYGFFCKKLASYDYKLGLRDGREIVKGIKKILIGSESITLQKKLILSYEFEKVSVFSGSHIWLWWVNFSWFKNNLK